MPAGVCSESPYGRLERGDHPPGLVDSLTEELLLFCQVTLHLAVEVVPREPAQRDPIQSAVPAGLVGIQRPCERVRSDALETNYIVAGVSSCIPTFFSNHVP